MNSSDVTSAVNQLKKKKKGESIITIMMRKFCYS